MLRSLGNSHMNRADKRLITVLSQRREDMIYRSKKFKIQRVTKSKVNGILSSFVGTSPTTWYFLTRASNHWSQRSITGRRARPEKLRYHQWRMRTHSVFHCSGRSLFPWMPNLSITARQLYSASMVSTLDLDSRFEKRRSRTINSQPGCMIDAISFGCQELQECIRSRRIGRQSCWLKFGVSYRVTHLDLL